MKRRLSERGFVLISGLLAATGRKEWMYNNFNLPR